MRDLNYALKQLCQRSRDGSFATQADRGHLLDQIADQLHEMGFRHMDAHSLKPKHVEMLAGTQNRVILGVDAEWPKRRCHAVSGIHAPRVALASI